MDIVIISEFCEDFSKTDNDRFLYIAKMLADENQVEVVTSTFRHTTKKHRKKSVADWPFKITFIEEPGYPKNVCVKRFFSHYVWGKNVLKYINNRKKPDVIYCAVPSLTGPKLVAKYCEKEKIRFVIDVQDLWPEAFQMVMNVPVISSIIFAPFRMLADNIYKRADAICAVSDTYCRRASSVNRKVTETTTVFLGTELATFDYYAAENPILEKKEEEVWIAYCGTLGSSYDLTCVIDALSILDDSRVRFIVMGDGPKQKDFESYATQKGVECVFMGRLPYDRMCAELVASDIVVNPIVGSSVATIINKHADYAASGLPVINTQNCKEYSSLVAEYKMGFNCPNGDAQSIAEKIIQLMDDPILMKQMGVAARRCAEERFDRETTYFKLINVIIGEGKCAHV